jgi:hypothetical protein
MVAESEDQVYICPHCGNKTLISIKSTFSAEEEIIFTDGEKGTIDYYFIIGQCRSCQFPLILGTDGSIGKNIEEADLIYPAETNISTDIPLEIKSSYEEAKKVKKTSSVAFAVMVRRTLEFLCQDKKAKGRSLNEQIKDLAIKNIVPKTLSEMTDILRTLGNIGAHANNIKIEKTEVEIMDDFLKAVLEYVYIAPAKIERIKKRLNDKKSVKT